MKKYLQVTLILSQILIFELSGRLQNKLFPKKKIEINRLDGLCVGKDVIFLTYMHGATSNSMEAFCSNSTLVILEDYDDDNKCNFAVHRCKSRENLDTCELVYSRENLKICQLMDMNNINLSPLAVPYQPPIQCPGKRGTHHAYNFTINLTPFIFFPLEDWYWKFNVTIYSSDNTKLLGCGILEAHQLVNSRI